jgi:hypothetical protein
VVENTSASHSLVPEIVVMESDDDFPEEVEMLTPTAPPDN